MRRLLSLFLLLSLSALAAEPLPLVQAETVGMSTERLAKINDWVDGMIERKEAAGFVTLVARRGKVVHHEARGTLGLLDGAGTATAEVGVPPGRLPTRFAPVSIFSQLGSLSGEPGAARGVTWRCRPMCSPEVARSDQNSVQLSASCTFCLD